ncbi:uncharacterized protein LOC134747936 [Cydia strobilella]|uniref:uncharacterized protein LOC134747936 n=1 Tax=Cydia strobilella TaxID=1100964 RepID=UPI00300667E6
MDDILKELKKIQKELNEQKITIQESGKSVTDQVTKNINELLEEKFCVWEQKHEKLKEIVENQEKRIYFLEKQARNRNVVFFGIEETESSYDTLEKNTIRWIEQYLTIKLNYSDIQEAKRLGKKGEKPRPLVVTFSTLGLKIKMFKEKHALKDTHYYMKEDYPKYVLEKRKELRDQLKLEREKGNIAILKYDKLIITKNNTKRKLETSPINNNLPNEAINSQANKKNKIQSSESSVKRSNSVTNGVIKPGMLNFLVNKNTETNKNQASKVSNA